MHALWRHPNGYWYILHGPRLKRRVSTREKDRRAAEAFLARFIADADNPRTKSLTVGMLLTQYEEEHGPEVRSPGALKFAVIALTRHIGDLFPKHLTPLVTKRYASERDASPGTILREIGVLRAALAHARAYNRLEVVPLIRNPVPTPAPRTRWLTREEGKALLDACHELHLRVFVALAMMTAARRNAILELRWSQVDLEKRLIDYGPGHGNKRRAVAPINGKLLDILTSARRFSSDPVNGFVVEFRAARVLDIKTAFRAACRRAKLSEVTPHILRHSAASWMAQARIPFREIALMLGDEEKTVERVYAKFSPEYLREAASALEVD